MTHDYGPSSTASLSKQRPALEMYIDTMSRVIHLSITDDNANGQVKVWLSALSGDVVFEAEVSLVNGTGQLKVPQLP